MLKGMMDLRTYERMSPERAWNDYNWGSMLAPGSAVYRREFDGEATVMVGRDEEGTFWCEIDGDLGDGWEELGQGWGEWRDEAMALAVVDIVGHRVMREESCCEDAVNCSAYEAYQLVYGETPVHKLDEKLYTPLFEAAKRFVKENIDSVDYDWEDVWS